MKKWIFILNPVAGAGRLKKQWPGMKQALEAAALPFEERWTKQKGDASHIVKKLIKAGHRQIVGVGGDGTNNEILNGIYAQQIVSPLEVHYALLPFGTGNDWVRTHRIPHNMRSWIAMIKEQHTIQHDLGWVEYTGTSGKEKRYFANVAGMAYDAHIVKVAEGYAHTSKRKLLYLWLVLRELIGFTPPALNLSFNDEKLSQEYYTINVGICKYSGGGMQLVSHADPQSGQLALTLIRKFPKWRVILDTPKLFSGKLAKYRYARLAHTLALEVHAANGAELLAEVDGEYIGTGPLRLGVIPKAVRVVVPK